MSLRRFVWHFVRQSAPLMLTVALMGGIMAALDLVAPLAIGKLFELLASGSLLGDTWRSSWPTLMALAALMLLVRPVLQFAYNRLVNVGMLCGFASLVRWQGNVQVLRRNLPFFQQDLSGRIVSHVMRIGPALTNGLVQGLWICWQLLLFVGISISLLAQAHWLLCMPIACWLVLTATLLAVTVPVIRQAAEVSHDRLSQLTASIVDVYANIATVIAFGRSPRELETIGQANRAYDSAQRRQMEIITIQGLLQSLLNAAMVVGTAAVGMTLLQDHRIDAGDLAIAIPLAWQASSISAQITHQISFVIENIGNVRDAMESVAPSRVDPARPHLRPLQLTLGAIRFEAVSFSYRAGLGVIEDFTLSVKPGERVGLIGASGSGKSTLLSLLLAVQQPDAGRVLIDDQDVSTLDPDSVRAVIGYVPQDPVLFHRSIHDNIAYGRTDASPADVHEAARRAHAADFIDKHVDWKGRVGYEAQVGDRGAQLSGGQRQRLGIARVLLKDAPILVLDEATNALDAETEAAIQRELATMMDGKTVIAIAHRLSTIAQLDRLVVIDGGRIVEEGSHAVLLARGGRYARLWGAQRANFL